MNWHSPCKVFGTDPTVGFDRDMSSLDELVDRLKNRAPAPLSAQVVEAMALSRSASRCARLRSGWVSAVSAMGQAEAQDLGLEGGALYDPLGNYRRVAGDFWDWSTDPKHPTISTRTVTPAEEPRVVTQPPQ